MIYLIEIVLVVISLRNMNRGLRIDVFIGRITSAQQFKFVCPLRFRLQFLFFFFLNPKCLKFGQSDSEWCKYSQNQQFGIRNFHPLSMKSVHFVQYLCLCTILWWTTQYIWLTNAIVKLNLASSRALHGVTYMCSFSILLHFIHVSPYVWGFDCL